MFKRKKRGIQRINVKKCLVFILNMEEIDCWVLREKSIQLVAIYSADLKPDFENEIIQLKTMMNHFSDEEILTMKH